jgi:hypothetical protein
MIWPLVLDVVVAALLVVTIIYAARLNNRLAVLRDDRDRLRELIGGLQNATRQAEDAVRALKLNAAESGQDLQEKIDRCQAMRADLAFLLDRGDKAADRLEASVRQPPVREPKRVLDEPPPPRAPISEEPGRSRLSQLLRQASSSASDDAPPPSTPLADPSELPAASPKSRSERDLLRALGTRR